jgi:myo-inositol 2-dehydrogenase / D-chiro-inositol 1-dehydrogenase
MRREAKSTSRRSFLMNSAATTAAVAATASLANVAHARGADTLRVGLVGCGGRGTGAAEQALTADKGTKLVAMADVFEDRLNDSLASLESLPIASQIDVPTDRRYSGFDAYKSVIDQVDVVLLTSTPHFRPQHFAYAVEKGVHAFVEKPMAVDAPGLRTFLQAVKDSTSKGLSVVNGFCWRYYTPRRENMKQVFEGKFGDIVAVETTYNSQGVWDPRKTRDQCASDMEYQLRNWYYYTWLSGDHIVEQAIHGIDTMAWALGDKPPTQCWGVGGRQVRTDPKYGNIYDHFSIVYEYPDNVRGYHHCRHWPNTAIQVKDYILGTKGMCDVFGKKPRGKDFDMYQTEHDEMFAALRAGKPINNGEQAAYSTLLGIMGRMAAYTGKVITWDDALNSKEVLGPATYEWGPAPSEPVPVPGITNLA